MLPNHCIGLLLANDPVEHGIIPGNPQEMDTAFVAPWLNLPIYVKNEVHLTTNNEEMLDCGHLARGALQGE